MRPRWLFRSSGPDVDPRNIHVLVEALITLPFILSDDGGMKGLRAEIR